MQVIILYNIAQIITNIWNGVNLFILTTMTNWTTVKTLVTSGFIV